MKQGLRGGGNKQASWENTRTAKGSCLRTESKKQKTDKRREEGEKGPMESAGDPVGKRTLPLRRTCGPPHLNAGTGEKKRFKSGGPEGNEEYSKLAAHAKSREKKDPFILTKEEKGGPVTL